MKHLTEMMMKTKEKAGVVMPKWFDGTIYREGDTVTNPFSGDSALLDRYALSMYDLIMGFVHLNRTHEPMFRKAMDWFRRNYPAEYMTLLD